ncbi:MAG: hypothetical protein H0V76_07790 [Blastocatellia bacterium]|nr:hypothetical protein [Blastocatellia bacterium]
MEVAGSSPVGSATFRSRPSLLGRLFLSQIVGDDLAEYDGIGKDSALNRCNPFAVKREIDIENVVGLGGMKDLSLV